VVSDGLVAGTTAALALVGDVIGRGGWRGAWVFDLALAAPLLWRRRWPLGVFMAVSLIAFVEWLTDTPARGTLALLVALYAVGAYESRRWAVAFAAVTTEVGVVMATLRWAPSDHRLSALALLTGTVTAAWVSGSYARTRRAFLNAALERAATAERERDQQALLATAAERARISREMHDVVAHTLSVMVALSDGAALSVARDSESARDAMEKSATLGRQALADLRRLLGGLRPREDADLSPVPGIDDVEALVAAVRSAGLSVDLVMAGQPREIPPGLQGAVYRLVQESLTNVLKHAPAATHVVVALSYEPGAVHLEVVNDGVFEPPSVASSTSGSGNQEGREGQGVTGMKERAAVFGGSVLSGPRPHGGWRVEARLPLDAPEAGG
jgi:signal transduction histidine kinase